MCSFIFFSHSIFIMCWSFSQCRPIDFRSCEGNRRMCMCAFVTNVCVWTLTHTHTHARAHNAYMHTHDSYHLTGISVCEIEIHKKRGNCLAIITRSHCITCNRYVRWGTVPCHTTMYCSINLLQFTLLLFIPSFFSSHSQHWHSHFISCRNQNIYNNWIFRSCISLDCYFQFKIILHIVLSIDQGNSKKKVDRYTCIFDYEGVTEKQYRIVRVFIVR